MFPSRLECFLTTACIYPAIATELFPVKYHIYASLVRRPISFTMFFLNPPDMTIFFLILHFVMLMLFHSILSQNPENAASFPRSRHVTIISLLFDITYSPLLRRVQEHLLCISISSTIIPCNLCCLLRACGTDGPPFFSDPCDRTSVPGVCCVHL